MICAGCRKEIRVSYANSDYSGNYCAQCFEKLGFNVQNIPTNWVSVIRCKDCVYWHCNDKKGIAYCDHPGESLKSRLPDDFCSVARKKEVTVDD